MVSTVRNSAEEEIFRRVESIIDEVLMEGLDGILHAELPNRPTPLAWLRQSATSNSPKTILSGLNKLGKLQHWQVGNWNLSAINPNRRKQLAQIGFRSTAQVLSRMNKTRRYPILPAFLSQLHEEVLNELVELFDRLLVRSFRVTHQTALRRHLGGRKPRFNDLLQVVHHANRR